MKRIIAWAWASPCLGVPLPAYGIAAERLAGKGAGPLCPISSNKNENGRKLNRRVELVEM